MALTSIKPMVSGLRQAVAPMPKKVDPFYTGEAWRSLVADIKRVRGAHCERCGSAHRVIGDHIVEIKDGGAPLDPANVELLCQAHHNAKTAQARARRAMGGG